MKRILIFIPLILLPACASKKPIVVQMPHSVPGTTLATDDMESVRYGENLKAYSFGRYIDPNDGLVMHEAHTVYRVETTAKWNLHPNAPVTVPSGPVVGIIDPAHRDSPVTPEVVAEVDRQKAATMALIVQGQRMNEALNQLSKTLSATAQVAAENVQLKNEATATEKRLDALEEEFRKTQTEAQFTTPATPSVKGTNDW
jgi:ribosomal protein L12E/L44/L45/RPP1/RPP2